MRFAAAVIALGAGACVPAAIALDFTTATIADLNRAIDAGQLSSAELVDRYLTRIAAYNDAGPRLNSIIAVNPKARETAQALDAERERTGRRSALHGIPVVIKDNIDTTDLATTAGSFVLAGSRPADDAFVVKRLREAGAIILAKTNMSEFASGPAMSSVAGRIVNPHNPARSPGGSSGGTGVAVAAGFASVGLGTDTGGSVRIPAFADGIVGLKTSYGLVSRDGVVPLALSLDTVGPMGRSVADVAALLSVIAGTDRADATTATAGAFKAADLARLDPGALTGVRIGVAREFMGGDAEIDWLTENALSVLRNAGAEIIDVTIPGWLRSVHIEWGWALIADEFPAQIPDYLATLDRRYPKTFDDLVARAKTLSAPNAEGFQPNPARWTQYLKPPPAGSHYQFDIIRQSGLPMVRTVLAALFAANRIEAIVYPTRSRPMDLVESPSNPLDGYKGPLLLANTSGRPELVVPIVFGSLGMPVGLSLLGQPMGDARLLALGHALEQRLGAFHPPPSTPPLPGDAFGN
jgi:amidase